MTNKGYLLTYLHTYLLTYLLAMTRIDYDMRSDDRGQRSRLQRHVVSFKGVSRNSSTKNRRSTEIDRKVVHATVDIPRYSCNVKRSKIVVTTPLNPVTENQSYHPNGKAYSSEEMNYLHPYWG